MRLSLVINVLFLLCVTMVVCVTQRLTYTHSHARTRTRTHTRIRTHQDAHASRSGIGYRCFTSCQLLRLPQRDEEKETVNTDVGDSTTLNLVCMPAKASWTPLRLFCVTFALGKSQQSHLNTSYQNYVGVIVKQNFFFFLRWMNNLTTLFTNLFTEVLYNDFSWVLPMERRGFMYQRK